MTTKRKLQENERRRYIARVRDLEGDHPKYGDDWFRVITRARPDGLHGTRAQAQDTLEAAIRNYHHGRLAGHTSDVIIEVEPKLGDLKIDDWVKGDVVPIRDVPTKYRDDYRDTLDRAALAAYRYGHPIWVNESFRTRAEQERFWQIYLAGGPLAARPGTSAHELGLALDIPNARNTPALIRELRKLGLVDNVKSEIWHVENTTR